MESELLHKKKPTPYRVGTEKMPIWLFEAVEDFRKRKNLPTRQAALNILIAMELRNWKLIETPKCQEFINNSGLPYRYKEVGQ